MKDTAATAVPASRASRAPVVLCAVDLSVSSRHALRLAADVTNRTGGSLVVLTVNDPLLLAVAAATFHRRKDVLARSETELGRFVADAVASHVAPARAVACRVAEGNPADEILKAAGQLKTDLLVVGTHGLGGIENVLFGSTTERLLRHVTSPVLVVPPVEVNPIARVIVPVDLDGEWLGELKRAAKAARWFDAELVVAHVVRRAQLPEWLRQNREVDRQRLVRARRAVEQARSKVPRGIETVSRVLVGDPADQIAALAGGGPSSVVVMGLRGAPRARKGSTTYRVIAHAVAPVLVLPRPV